MDYHKRPMLEAWAKLHYSFYRRQSSKSYCYRIPLTNCYTTLGMIREAYEFNTPILIAEIDQLIMELLDNPFITQFDKKLTLLEILEYQQDGQNIEYCPTDYSEDELKLIDMLPFKGFKGRLANLPLIGGILSEWMIIGQLLKLYYSFTVITKGGKEKSYLTKDFNEVLVHAAIHPSRLKINEELLNQLNRYQKYLLSETIDYFTHRKGEI